ncbi:MAG: DUF3836 domain-containing protein [Dysgonomonas sp.]|nr:DUF3836 domain-containing protein [Dysgonomonas sp.]
MKAKAFFSLFVILFFSANIFAATPEKVMFSNIEETESGKVKEILFCDKDTNAPLTKTIYKYDTEGKIEHKASYEWNRSHGWVGTQKYEYTYDENNTPSTPVVKKWDKKTKDWTI